MFCRKMDGNVSMQVLHFWSWLKYVIATWMDLGVPIKSINLVNKSTKSKECLSNNNLSAGSLVWILWMNTETRFAIVAVPDQVNYSELPDLHRNCYPCFEWNWLRRSETGTYGRTETQLCRCFYKLSLKIKIWSDLHKPTAASFSPYSLLSHSSSAFLLSPLPFT